jgi:hypothetical protein
LEEKKGYVVELIETFEKCQKKYSFSSSGGTKCPDYTRDLNLPKENDKMIERKKPGA